jgi:hypothetical protein
VSEAAVAPIPAASDLAAPSAPAAPVGGPPPRAVEVVQQMTPGTALIEIESRKADKAFYALLMKKDPAATAEWNALHTAAHNPPSKAIASIEDAANEANIRNTAMWQSMLTKHKERGARLSPAQEADYLSSQLVEPAIRKAAELRIAQIIAHKPSGAKVYARDPDAADEWERMHMILEKPVRRE